MASRIIYWTPYIEAFSNDQSNGRFLRDGKTFCPSGKSLDGVIVYLTSKREGNVHDQGLIAAISSSIYGSSPSCHSKDATDLHS
jgi:hypothetical protein